MNQQVIDKLNQLEDQLNQLVTLPSLNSKECNFLYNLAANKCQSGDFKHALPLFQFLVLLEPDNCLYIKGLAGTLHGIGNYAEAIEMYKTVYLLDTKLHFDCLFYMSDCYMNLDKPEEARKNLDLFIAIVSTDLMKEKYESQLKRAKLVLAGIANKHD